MPQKSSLVRFHTRLSAFMLVTFLLLGILAGLLLLRGSRPILLLGTLMLLMAAWAIHIHIYISRPFRQFLEFILALSRRQPQPEFKLPACWLPWFNTVEGIFRDNEQLTAQIACQNRMLEQRVARRTRELERSNAALREANRRLQDLSMLDGLTQLANYRHFESFLGQIWGLMQRRREPVSLLLCDVDYFKQYNDTYGHQAGNECLRAIANVLSELAHRSSDLAARYGGEEFILLLPGLEAEQARRFATRIQRRITELAIPHSASEVAAVVTVSIGVAALAPSAENRPQQLFKLADEALYRAKSRGRNCIA